MHPAILFATAFFSALLAQPIPDTISVGAALRLFIAAAVAGLAGLARPQNVPPPNPPAPPAAPTAPTVIVNNPPASK